MTLTEIKTAVQEHNITDELINALVLFSWDFDTYGFLNEYGAIDDEGVREAVAEEMRYQVEHCTEELIESLDFAINENSDYFRANY